MTGAESVVVGVVLLGFEPVEPHHEFSDLTCESGDFGFLLTQCALQVPNQTGDVTKLAFHRERSFRALLAARDGDVVKAFTGGGEEEGIGAVESEVARGCGVLHDVAITQLRQNDFQGLPEAIKYANAAR